MTPLQEQNIKSNSIDVTLGDELLVYSETVLDCKVKPKTTSIKIPSSGIILMPGELYLGHTAEYTETHGLVPIMFGKSSVARLGLSVYLAAGFGDNSFCGKWTLEFNAIKPIKVYTGMPIAQIAYNTIEGDAKDTYQGKYQGDKTVKASEYYKNFT